MLRFLRKKNPDREKVEKLAAAADRIAALILVDIPIMRFDVNYKERLKYPAVRGYLLGFFDAATEMLLVDGDNQSEYMAYLILAHRNLGLELDEANNFVSESVQLAGNDEVLEGVKLGESDFQALMSEGGDHRLGLERLMVK